MENQCLLLFKKLLKSDKDSAIIIYENISNTSFVLKNYPEAVTKELFSYYQKIAYNYTLSANAHNTRMLESIISELETLLQ